ncbi:MAG: AAA family ATPase [Spirochaetaceae bacterium]|nr:AAA family ATPase [Spirochaetaceae bacterium]
MTELQMALRQAGLSYAAVARELGISKPAVVEIALRGRWPRKREEELREQLAGVLADRGVKHIATRLSGSDEQQEEGMQRVSLSTAARRQFGLLADPWDVRGPDDVYLAGDWRFAAECLATTAETGGMMALIGESGSGKSTLRRYVVDRLKREDRPVKVIEPQTIDRGRLTAGAICDAIIEDVSLERPRRALESKARQVRRVLTESARSGASHVLMLEEGHDLAIPTLKYLKRFWELEDGFTKLLGIVVLAQPEMRSILDESRSYEAREVIRRIEVIELGPLDPPGDLEGFLAARIGGGAFADEAYGAIRARLSRRTRGGTVSLAYPLTVANVVTRALNLAAEMGQQRIDAHTIAQA